MKRLSDSRLVELAFVAQSVGDPHLIDSEIQFAASELHLIYSVVRWGVNLCSLPSTMMELSLCSLPGLEIVVHSVAEPH